MSLNQPVSSVSSPWCLNVTQSASEFSVFSVVFKCHSISLLSSVLQLYELSSETFAFINQREWCWTNISVRRWRPFHWLRDKEFTTTVASFCSKISHRWKLKTAHSRINCKANFCSVKVVCRGMKLAARDCNEFYVSQAMTGRHLCFEIFVRQWYLAIILHLVYDNDHAFTRLWLT